MEKIFQKKSLSKSIWIFLVCLMSLIAPSAFAAPELVIMGKPVIDIVTDLISWLVTITVILAILMVVIGGIVYIFSSGDPRKAEFAKKIIFWALGGLMIAGISYAVIVLVEKIAIK